MTASKDVRRLIRMLEVKRQVLLILRNVTVNTIAGSDFCLPPLRLLMYRLAGIETETIKIRAHCIFTSGRVRIGKGTFINYRCVFDGDIDIGTNCDIAMDVLFCGTSHHIGGHQQRAGQIVFLPIHIENGCWIGARSVILPGVTVGEGSIIAAGSVVTKDCERDSIYAGVPAQLKRRLE